VAVRIFFIRKEKWGKNLKKRKEKRNLNCHFQLQKIRRKKERKKEKKRKKERRREEEERKNLTV